MMVLNDDNYKIITQDNYGNLLIGYLVIKNKKLLKEICNVLVQDRMYDFLINDQFDDFFVRQEEDNFNIKVEHCKCSNDDCLPKVQVNENFLIRRNNFKEHNGHITYDEYTYEFAFLNSFLILSSLLGEVDVDKMGSNAKNFLNYGIIKKLSFFDAWRECGKNLLKNKDGLDMEFFREFFNSGLFVDYVVTDIIEFNYLKDKNVLKTLDVMLSEIAHNSEMLGTYNKGKHYSR